MTMLYEVFDSLKQALGDDHFISRLDDEIVRNLNPKFGLREYQKEALGRFDFYLPAEASAQAGFGGYQQRRRPAQLLFHMATGSGMILKKRNHKISIYQVFIKPKGNWTYDMNQRFELSKEGWKQKFLLELEGKAEVNLEVENKQFKLVGLPFYNEQLKKEFEEVFEGKLLS